jgi:hypothetical protein
MDQNKLKDFMEAYRLLGKHGDYDTSIAGAIGEAYAEEKLGMEKAPAGTKGYDGWIAGRKVQVKTKAPRKAYDSLAHQYAAITHKNHGLADDLVVVLIDQDSEITHLGPVQIDKLHYTENKTERRYRLDGFKEILEGPSKKMVKKSSSRASTELPRLQLKFWTGFHEYLVQKGSPLKSTKPQPLGYMDFRVGTSKLYLSASISSQKKRIGTEVYIGCEEAKSVFHLLAREKKTIEEALAFSLEWMELPNKKHARIILYLYDVEPLNEDNWQKYWDWMKVHLEKLFEVIPPKVKAVE